MSGRVVGGARRGQGGHGKFGERAEERGHVEILMAEVNLGVGDGGGDEREWVRDSRADNHMSSTIMLVDKLESIPQIFFVKQIKGKVPDD